MEILGGIDMMETGNQAISLNKESALAKNKSRVFEELMAYQKKVFLICLGFCRNTSDAQDLAQEVYLKAYKNINTLEDISLSRYWLFRIARNACLNFRKKHRLDRISAIEMIRKIKNPQSPESEFIYQEQLLLLKETIHRLPRKQRDVFIMKEYGDLSYEEIAKTLNIKMGTVMSRLNRARQAIREQIEGDKNA